MTKRKETRHYSKDIPKFCAFCNEEFLGYRHNAKYCSDTCKYAWQHRNACERIKIRRKEYQKKWGTENWQQRRDYHIKRVYGLSAEQYQELLEKQHYNCAICGRHETDFARKLAIDHDKVTGEIYGLLCGKCNYSFVGDRRDPSLYVKAAEYLTKGTGLIVPVKIKKKKRRKKRCKITKTTKKLLEQLKI